MDAWIHNYNKGSGSNRDINCQFSDGVKFLVEHCIFVFNNILSSSISENTALSRI
jgi:hypothetical protein